MRSFIYTNENWFAKHNIWGKLKVVTYDVCNGDKITTIPANIWIISNNLHILHTLKIFQKLAGNFFLVVEMLFTLPQFIEDSFWNKIVRPLK